MARLLAPAPFIVALLLAPAALGADTVEQVVAKVREATGADALARIPGGVRLTGEAEFLGGVPAMVEAIFDARGRSYIDIRGPLRQVTAFDGTQAWSIDLGGETRVLHLGDRQRAVLNGHIASHRCFSSDATFNFTHDAGQSDAKSVVLDFSHDDARITGSVEIDRAVWLPVKWTVRFGDETTTYSFEGLFELGGAKFPAVVHQISSRGRDQHFRFTAIGAAGTDAERAFRFVPSPPNDVLYDAGVPTKLETKRSGTQHLLVRPLVDGKDVGWFLFDTGAGLNVLNEKTARDLGCQPIGTVPATGAAGSVRSTLYHCQSISLGPVTMQQPLCMGLDLSRIGSAIGEKVAGIIGFPILWRCCAEIDAEKGFIALHGLNHWKDRQAAWSPLMLYHRQPCVPARFEGHEGNFVIDTGAGHWSVFFYSFETKRLGLLEGRKTEEAEFGGVGGTTKGHRGTLAHFELAGRRLENVQAMFATQAAGAMADPYLTGNVGGGILKGRVLLLDYQRGRIAIVDRE